MATKPKPRTAHDYCRDLQRMALLIPQTDGLTEKAKQEAKSLLIKTVTVLMEGTNPEPS